MKILIIEEDKITRNLLNKIFGSKYDIEVCGYGDEAIHKISEFEYDLILVEHTLKDMKGAELFNKLREKKIKIPPFIISTGQGDEMLAVEMMKMGAVDYIVKDINYRERILEAIEKAEITLQHKNKLLKTEESLKTSEEKFRSLYENAPLAYQSLDFNGNIIDVNPHWLKTLGYERDEVLGRPFGDFWPEEVRNYFPQKFQELKECGCKNNLQLVLQKKTGEYINASYEAQVGYWPDGKFKQTYCVFKDVTQEKKTQDSLLQSEERLNLAVTANKDGLYDWDLTKNEIYLSPQWKEMIGYFDDEIDNSIDNFYKFISDEDKSKIKNIFENMINGSQDVINTEFKMIHKNGSHLEILSRGKRILDKDGFPARIVGINTNLTARNKLSDVVKIITDRTSQYTGIEFLQNITKQFSNIISSEVISISKLKKNNPDVLKTLVNLRNNDLSDNFEYSITDCPCEKIISEKNIIISNNLSEEYPNVKRITQIDVDSFIGLPLLDSQNNVAGILACFFKDEIQNSEFIQTILKIFSVRIASEIEREILYLELKDSEYLLRESLKISKMAGWRYNIESDELDWNSEFYKIFNFDEKIDSPSSRSTLDKFYDFFDKDTLSLINEKFNACKNQGFSFEIECSGGYSNNQIKWIRINGKAIKEEGRLVKIIGNVLDFTDKKLLERKNIEKERLSAIGEMASGIAHDFNNSLQVILGNLELAFNSAGITDELKSSLKNIEKNVINTAERVKVLRRFSGITDSQKRFTNVKISEILEDIIIQSSPIWKSNSEKTGLRIQIVKNFQSESYISVNPAEFSTAILNLLKNSVEAMPDGGEILISTFDSDNFAHILIGDQGIGMDYETSKRIFQPFYSTKGIDGGRGLGLSNVMNIISEYNGKIKLQKSEINVGTTFEITLPLAKKEKTAIVNNEIINKNSSDISILWVDDDQDIIQNINELNNFIDARIDTISTGIGALEILKSKKYDFVITDIGMPDMSGWSLIEEIRKLYGDEVKIGVSTGWSDESINENAMKYKVSKIFNKPFRISQVISYFNK